MNAGSFVMKTQTSQKITYRPIIFTAIAFTITWISAVVLSYMDMGTVIMYTLDFVKSASPLIAAMILLRKYINKRFLRDFFFGQKQKPYRYLIVALIFAVQFFNFYLFPIEKSSMAISEYVMIFMGQIVFGGALEEAGWRGYLQPALERKLPVVWATLCVGLIWAAWHIPYFLLPGSMHSQGNFLFYVMTTVVTGFILTAIYKLTGSVLLCTLFHGWQNTIVMSIAADMGSVGFILIFALLGAAAVFICIAASRGKL